jgi:CubicO group peptidase (beta-lactamase class C family)
MQKNKKLLSGILIGILLFLVVGYFSSCTIRNMIKYNFADINDYQIFPKRDIAKPAAAIHFPTSNLPFYLSEVIPQANGNFEKYLADNQSVAFLIIHNDTLQYEKYFENYNASSIVTSFSMAKSVTSILIGCALQDSLIHSVQEPITNYIPELKNKKGFDKITIEHLLKMTSGIHFNESYWNPFGEAAKFYYGDDIKNYIANLRIEYPAGEKFDYISGNTQLLGLILERSLKTKTVTAYLQEKIWTPLGMEYDASWSMDNEKDGMEKTFCCINARARDFAKIGELYLHKGNWNGKQIINTDWVTQSTKVDTSNGSAWFYQYQWWLPSQEGDFMAQGILGQYIYVNPNKNIVIVRLGKTTADVEWKELFMQIAKLY